MTSVIVALSCKKLWTWNGDWDSDYGGDWDWCFYQLLLRIQKYNANRRGEDKRVTSSAVQLLSYLSRANCLAWSAFSCLACCCLRSASDLLFSWKLDFLPTGPCRFCLPADRLSLSRSNPPNAPAILTYDSSLHPRRLMHEELPYERLMDKDLVLKDTIFEVKPFVPFNFGLTQVWIMFSDYMAFVRRRSPTCQNFIVYRTSIRVDTSHRTLHAWVKIMELGFRILISTRSNKVAEHLSNLDASSDPHSDLIHVYILMESISNLNASLRVYVSRIRVYKLWTACPK